MTKKNRKKSKSDASEYLVLKDFRNNTFKMYQRDYQLEKVMIEVKSDYATYDTMDNRLKESFDKLLDDLPK